MRRRLRGEQGTVIVMAIALMTVMMAIGLAAYSFVDAEQTSAMNERHRESSFNFSEAALNTQAFILARRWPGSVAGAYPEFCNPATAPLAYCPQPAQLAAAYATPDFANNTTWRTEVRDNVSGQFYDNAVQSSQFRYDENRDSRVWLRSDAWVRGRHLATVALIEVEQRVELLPERTMIAGKFSLIPNGNHTYIDTNPSATSNHPVTLRCTPPATPSQADPCTGYTPDSDRPQIDPPGTPQGYIGPEYQNADALGDSVKERLLERAVADGTHFNGCPSGQQLTGKVVWVANCPSPPVYQANGAWNSAADPGILVWEEGVLQLSGNGTYWGIIYNLNNTGLSSNCVSIRGGVTVMGGVFVDGACGVEVGANTMNIDYYPGAFTSIRSYGSAGVVQNSWRQLAG